jgi:hypothetical protein
MNRSRTALIALMFVIGAFLGGWLVGRSGRGALEEGRNRAELQHALEQARVAILHGRLELTGRNFGNASQQFDRARTPLQSAKERLTGDGRDADAARVDAAVAAITQAQQLALALNQEAEAKASEALKALDGITFPPAPSGL